MKIINCGYVTYIITAHHIATIVYSAGDGQPAATIYYDGKMGEIVEAYNGQTMRYAVRLAKWQVRRDEYVDEHHDEWVAKLLKRNGWAYR